MRVEVHRYPFKDEIIFVSECEKGTCFLSCHKLIVEKDGKRRKLSLPQSCFTEAYAISENKVLLVRESSFGSIEDVFSFEIFVLDINRREILIHEKIKRSDYRGLKVMSQSVFIAFNSYTSGIVDQFDYLGLQYDPPCSEHCNAGEVVELDFDLKEISRTIYDDVLPDDLILSYGGICQKPEIVFNSSIWSYRDKILWASEDEIYLISERSKLVKRNLDGVEELIYESPEIIKGVGVSLTNSLPEYRLYLRDQRVDLHISNSLQYIIN